jgi:flagellar motor protein MotB
MITLLLGFYIMYFSIEPPKKGNTSLTESLIKALVKVDSGGATEAKAPPQKDVHQDPQAPTATDAMQMIMNMVMPKLWVEKLTHNALSAKSQTSAIEATKEGVPTGSATSQPKASDYRMDVTPIQGLDAEARRVGDRVYITFPQISFFASASTDMTSEGRQALEKFAKVYMPFAGKAVLGIVGFSDERPVKGHYRFRDNLELSVLRAVSAQRVAESVGIPLNRTRLMGHGINSQLIEGEEPSNALERWALTRKVMLVIEPEVQ